MSHRGAVVIVGGGIIGVNCAWYLSRSGWQVTVVDRKTIGGACSFGNCGLVCPSHVLPLTEPGAFAAAVKAMLSPGSPFRIQPRLDPALWSWMWQFSRRCNQQSMISAAHAIQALLVSSMREYEALVHVDKVDCEWQAKGLMFAYQSSRALDNYAKTDKLLAELFSEPAKRLTAAEAVALEPALKPEIAGAWLYEHDAHLRPDRLIQSMRKRLEDAGVRFREHCELIRFTGANRSAAAVETTEGTLHADVFVVASGAWTPMLHDHLGCTVPIQPGKGYSITMPRPKICPQIPLIFPEHRVAVTPMNSGYRLGSIMEFAGYDESIKPERLQLLRSGAEHYLRDPYCAPEVETWYGWRPMTYDSLPVIDASPKWGNVWIAAGHNMLGLSMAPVTGRLIKELIDGETPHLDVMPYRVGRFL